MIPETLDVEDTSPNPPAPLLERQDPTLPEKEQGIDLILLGAILALIALGTVEIYSASAVFAAQKSGGHAYFLLRQLVYVGAGLLVMAWAARTDFGWLRRRATPILLAAFFLLGAVLLSGTKILGARRWFVVGPLSFQPVELAKLALVVYLASSLARKQEKIATFTVGFLPHLCVAALMMALLLRQPDLGSSIILGATTLLMLFVAGTKVSYILFAVLAAAPVVYDSVVGTPWRLRRLLAFLDPWQFRQGVGYQITESLISIGSGGWFGHGLGDGKQKLFYMPEAHTDFIMSNIGEELGFVGFVVVLSLFAVVIWRGLRAAMLAREAFGTYLAFGLTCIFALQTLVNTAVVLGAIPAKGLTLPFVSYGGTSLVTSMFMAGVILNVSRRSPTPEPSTARIRNAHRSRRKASRPVRAVPA